MERDQQTADRALVEEVVPAQMPRRFPVGAVLVLVTLFAVAMSLLQSTGYGRPEVLVFIGCDVILVGLGQAVLFEGTHPRLASVWAGVLAWVPLSLAIAAYEFWSGNPYAEDISAGLFIGAFLLAAPLGYLIGGVIAGAFLVLERIRTGRWNEVRRVLLPSTMAVAAPYGLKIDSPQPILRTERLLLQPFRLSDARVVQQLAGDAEVASTTASIPHPYPDGAAEAWISAQPRRYQSSQEVVFAVVRKEDGRLVGSIGLRLIAEEAKGELGYWIGRQYWNRGYATEAARAILAYGFLQLQLVSIYAHYMVRNPASGRVLEKIGMQQKGKLWNYLEKNGVREDCRWYEILRYEWDGSDRSKPA